LVTPVVAQETRELLSKREASVFIRDASAHRGRSLVAVALAPGHDEEGVVESEEALVVLGILLAVRDHAGHLILVAGNDELRVHPTDDPLQTVGPAVGEQHVDMLLVPKLGEPIEVRAWPGGAGPVAGLDDGEVLGGADEMDVIDYRRALMTWICDDLQRPSPALNLDLLHLVDAPLRVTEDRRAGDREAFLPQEDQSLRTMILRVGR